MLCEFGDVLSMDHLTKKFGTKDTTTHSTKPKLQTTTLVNHHSLQRFLKPMKLGIEVKQLVSKMSDLAGIHAQCLRVCTPPDCDNGVF